MKPLLIGLLAVALVVLVACGSAGTPTPFVQATAGSSTLGTPLPSAPATALPTQPPGAATALPAESPWAHANAADLAHTLAARVADAANDQARQAALLEVMRALNIGVYTPDGVSVLRGAERGPHDFYLYDFELAMMAASLDRRDAWTVADITAALNEMGIRPEDKPLADDQFTSILLTAAHDASQAPADHSSLPLLLARELGLRQPAAYDLLQAPKQHALSFSALQRFLITIDAVLPIVRQAKIAAAPSQLAAQSNGVLRLKPVSQTSACDSMIATVAKEGWGAGKLFVTLSGVLNITIDKLGTKLPAGTLAVVVIDALHGEMLAFSVAVQALPDPRETHYGHETPGAELQVRIIVAMRDQLPELLIQCGWLLGVEFPKKGPIAGVTMLWFTDGLEDHGQVICEADCKKTGPDGIATWRLKPKNEAPLYGWGPERRDMRFVTGIALYQSRHKNYLGSVAQIITPKGAGGPVVISYHDQPDLELHFDSAIDGTDPNYWLQANTHARVRLKYDAPLGWNGQGEMNYLVTPKPKTDRCEVTRQGDGTTWFKVIFGQIAGNVLKPTIMVPLSPGIDQETTIAYTGDGHHGCKVSVNAGVLPGTFLGMWGSSHLDIVDMTKGSYQVRDWEIIGNEMTTGVFARKTLKGNCKGMCTETTKLELSILPAPAKP